MYLSLEYVVRKDKYMLIAEVAGKRCKATKGAKGICPYCKSEVIAKCGEQKISHWAHKSRKVCDTWHDKETEWHLMWKSYFPETWQEIIKYDQVTGEKHIADVCTEKGFTLEFQHSAIKPEERQSREAFYKNMNWVVDCTRLKNDFNRFKKIINNISIARELVPISLPIQNQGNIKIGSIVEINYAEDIFPKNWLNSSVPVVFDFKGLNQLENQDIRHYIFCLLPKENTSSQRYAIQIPIPIFVENAKTGSWELFVNTCINELKKVIESKNKLSQTQYGITNILPRSRYSYYRKRRRF